MLVDVCREKPESLCFLCSVCVDYVSPCMHVCIGVCVHTLKTPLFYENDMTEREQEKT